MIDAGRKNFFSGRKRRPEVAAITPGRQIAVLAPSLDRRD
jgi:hypothetical protein